MTIRILSDSLINQIAAGEVVERPASVVKELVENALDAGADQIIVDISDGGRTLISVIDNGGGMTREDLMKSVTRHATSKLPDDDLLSINFMGFRGEALPSIASVSDMVIDTKFSDIRVQSSDNDSENRTLKSENSSGWQLDCSTKEIKPSPWESGTRIRVANLFARAPARLKFLRADRAEMISIVEVVKRLAMARPDVGFVLNNKWRFPKGQALLERVIAVMGDEVRDNLLEINGVSSSGAELSLRGYISKPTLRRASSVDQYLFVNGRPVKDKVLVGALRAAYMDVMSAREFPLCALYIGIDQKSVDVNVSPAKTEVHFLEPARVRGFIIKTLRNALAAPLAGIGDWGPGIRNNTPVLSERVVVNDIFCVRAPEHQSPVPDPQSLTSGPQSPIPGPYPLGRVIGQYGNKYIIAQSEHGLVIVDQHAAHERITYEHLRSHEIKVQPLLTPIVVNMKPEEVSVILEIKDEIKGCGLTLDQFGDDAIAIFEKPADWDMDWTKLLRDIADEVRGDGHSSALHERLHLKLANYACHHSVRAGQKLDYMQCHALLRDIENTERAGQCNHGRPVYKIIKLSELDAMFERI